MKVQGKQPRGHLKRVLSFHGPSGPRLVNANPPPEWHEAGEHRQRHRLEVELEALMKRADPVPERVVSAARRAFDRRWHAWGPTQPTSPGEHRTNGSSDNGSGNAS